MLAFFISALASFALLASGLVHLHPPVGWVDPGLYIYWFLSPSENLAWRGGEYHASRLPFVLPGILLYRLFDPVTAQALLVGGFHLLGVAAAVAVASAARLSMPSRVAIGLLWGWNPLVLAAFVRGYVDGPAMAAALCILACLLTPGDRAAPRMAAGALLLLAASMHPYAGGLAALTAIAVLLATDQASGQGGARNLARQGGAMLLGAAAAFLVLAGIGCALGFPFFYPGLSMAAFGAAAAGIGDSFVLPAGDWAPSAHRLILIPVVVGVALSALRAARPLDATARGLLAATAVPLGILLIHHAIAGFVLQQPFYASYLLLSLVPAAVLLARAGEAAVTMGAEWRRAVVLGVLLLACLVLGASLPLSVRGAAWFLPVTWAVLLATALALAVGSWRRRGNGLLLLAATLGLAGAMNRDTATILPLADVADPAAQHRMIGPLHQAVAEAGAARAPYLLWTGREGYAEANGLGAGQVYRHVHRGLETRMNALDSLGASLGWDVASMGFDLPRLDAEGVARLDESLARQPSLVAPFLIALCADAAACDQGARALATAGLSVEPVSRRELRQPGTPGVTLVVARLRADPDAQPDASVLARETDRLFLDGPNGARFRRDRIVVREILEPFCEPGRTTTACAFDVVLSTGERRGVELLLARAGLSWLRAPPDAPTPPALPEPSPAALQLGWERSLRASTGDPGMTVRDIRGTACDADWDRATCVFDYGLGTGERGTAELSFRRAGIVWRTTPAEVDRTVEATPGVATIRRALRDALLAGPAGDAVARGEIAVESLGNVGCEGTPRGAACAFTFVLTTGERREHELAFERPRTVWRRAGPEAAPRPAAEPGEAVLRAAFRATLLAGPNGERLRREGTMVTDVERVACDGTAAAMACAFDWRLGTGERGVAELTFDRPGVVWRARGPAAPGVAARPDAAAVRRALEAAILAGPGADGFRRAGTRVTVIRNLACDDGALRATCAFGFETSSGERGATRLSLQRVGSVWRRAT